MRLFGLTSKEKGPYGAVFWLWSSMSFSMISVVQ